MISIEMQSEPDSEWNKRLLDANLGTIQQTKEYALSKQLTGAEPLYLKFINDNGKILAQLLAILYSRFERKGTIGKILKKVSPKKYIVCKWVYGPIIFDSTFTKEIIKELYDFLHLKKFNVWGSEHPLSQVLMSANPPLKLEKWATFLIDLKKDQDSIWKNMDKHSARKNIERSQERNVKVKMMEKSDLNSYHNIGLESKMGSDLTISTIEKQWDILNQAGYTGFLAYENEIPIAGIKVSSFNGYVNEFSIVRSKRDASAKLYAQDLLKWKIIEWALQNKFKYYDLSGVNPDPKDNKEVGIFRYKQKWGGTLYKYNILKS